MKHGTTDASGKFVQQVVRLGRTRNGPGFFTGNYLVWSLTEAQYEAYRTDTTVAEAAAERLGFAYSDDSLA